MATIADLAAKGRALATSQVALSGGAIKFAGTQFAASTTDANKADVVHLSELVKGLTTGLRSIINSPWRILRP